MSLYKGTTLISGIVPDMANQSLSNLNSAGQDKFDAKVNKSGDTMTGNLTILKDNGLIAEKSSFDSTTTTAPSAFTNLGIFVMYDTNEHITGYVQNSFNTDNTVRTSIGARRIINGENKSATLSLNVDSSGSASCSFPETKCVDGQWISKSVTIMNSQSLNGSTVLTYTLSDVPNDGYKYEVLLTGQVLTGSTSGNSVRLEVDSDAVTDVVICAAQTRTASTMPGRGAVILPLTTSRKIYVLRSTSFNGTSTLYLRGYRRIGTNS